MNRALKKITYREIRRSLGRFLAIMGIVALGAGFLTGLRTTKSAMVETLNRYCEENALYDYEIISTLGLTGEDADYFASMDGVGAAEASVSTDALFTMPGGGELVLRAITVTQDVNTPLLRAGRMPERADECVLDSWYYGEDMIGSTITVSPRNDGDTRDMFASEKFTVVGLVNSPLYINFTRGTTTLGSGTVAGFVCIPADGFDTDYYTEIYLRLAQTGYVYTDEYDDAVDAVRSALETAAKERGQLRYDDIIDEAEEKLSDAESEYNDGLKEYNDGLSEYNDAKAEADEQLSDAMDQIYIAERAYAKARTELDDGWQKLSDAQSELSDKRAEFDSAKADTQATLDATRAQLDALQRQYSAALEQYNAAVAAYGEAAMASQKTQLDAMKAQLDGGEAQYAAGIAQLESAQKQLDDAQAALDANRADLEQGEKDYHDAYVRICEGRADYADAKAEADKELADAAKELSDAKAELDDGEQKLDDARSDVRGIKHATVYALDRYSNSGYSSFESDSNIVAAIARVFPLFFFLVAALVCVTTMNRMVDEQRTQTGVLKALGYTPGEIMRGYMLYTGLASGIGSVAGALLGSVVFPKMIWQAYNIMYGFTDITLVFDWTLIAVVCAAFLACSLAVTYASCKTELRQVPAELVRPMSPKPGKRILLERITFLWKRFGFLRKVSARNIFRYKKRMYMMIVGIAGCAALLITGFGINDSIAGLADVQYTEVSVYDAMVSFKENMTAEDEEQYLSDCGASVTDCAFLSMYSVDTQVNGQTKSVYLVATDTEDMTPFMNFSLDGQTCAYPGYGEVIINDYLAKRMGAQVGDTITLRDGDMNELTLTISGIFYNVIYNYAYVTMDTLRGAPGYKCDVNVAYLDLNEGAGLYESAAKAASSELAMSVSVNEQQRELIHNMLESMKYIVALVIFCAGALAFIVLYNLTNININERIREIATIKVLGFNRWETANYVFRENMALTVMGALVGVPLGFALHRYVMSQIHIDMISFRSQINLSSYLLALGITLVFALLVDVFMYRRLDRINMAESLKSVE